MMRMKKQKENTVYIEYDILRRESKKCLVDSFMKFLTQHQSQARKYYLKLDLCLVLRHEKLCKRAKHSHDAKKQKYVLHYEGIYKKNIVGRPYISIS